ncbi:hypothetical protein J4E90_001306 [Alternaria incomplexa]|uniref:uncharacterized protein n=1 Tax=Alternaria incomplexa TaxID=1187928 RepID=UPI00221F5E58|nr:uncharacterized protein J4E90_001306 [Alternaria incomplexa]KAI4922871.1 hypothetical protein J4E90_001306 [Alternaria incomplexa]
MDGPPKLPDILDYYDVLGVNERASYATIERCFKRLQQSHHPDSRRAGAHPSTVIFQNVGIAWDTLESDGKRAKYDKSYPRIRNQWAVYRTNLAKWNADQREIEQQHARAAARRKKVDEEKMEIERGKQKVLVEKAKEATRHQMERMETEKALLAKEAKAKEQIRQREQEAIRARERLQEESRRQEIARAEEEARIKTDWEKAQKQRKMTEKGSPQDTSNEDGALRELWREKQERTREQAKRAEATNEEAAQERLRKQQENLHQTSEDDHDRSAEPTSTESQERERLANKQRAANEREAKVMADAQKRQSEAAEERLRRQEIDATSLKRPPADDVEDEQDMTNPKKPKVRESMTPGLRKHMAREQARRIHAQRLQEVGGPGNEERLRDVSIDLGWKHVDYQNRACPQCHTKRSAAQYGLWQCPEGGALRCRPCLAALSTFSA